MTGLGVSKGREKLEHYSRGLGFRVWFRVYGFGFRGLGKLAIWRLEANTFGSYSDRCSQAFPKNSGVMLYGVPTFVSTQKGWVRWPAAPAAAQCRVSITIRHIF